LSPAEEDAAVPVTSATPAFRAPQTRVDVVAPPVPEPPSDVPKVSTNEKALPSNGAECGGGTSESSSAGLVSGGTGSGGAPLFADAKASTGAVLPNAVPKPGASPSAEAAKRFVAAQEQASNSDPTPEATNPWQQVNNIQQQAIDPKQQAKKPAPPATNTMVPSGQVKQVKQGSEDSRMGLGVAFNFNDNSTGA